jgi:hypothetical protein
LKKLQFFTTLALQDTTVGSPPTFLSARGSNLGPRFSFLSVLPDDLFSNQKYIFCKFWRDLQLKMLVYFMEIRYTLWPFGIHNLRRLGIFCSNLEYFYPFLYVVQRKIWQPWIFYIAIIPPPLQTISAFSFRGQTFLLLKGPFPLKHF